MNVLGNPVESLHEGLKGYIAGIIDGEGSIGFRMLRYKGKESYHPRIHISITDSNVLNKIADITGMGTLCELNKLTSGGKNVYSWGVHYPIDVYMLLKAILPYLIIKKGQAMLMIEFCELKISKRLSNFEFDRIHSDIRVLNRRGSRYDRT